jgi:hypothetical protein
MSGDVDRLGRIARQAEVDHIHHEYGANVRVFDDLTTVHQNGYRAIAAAVAEAVRAEYAPLIEAVGKLLNGSGATVADIRAEYRRLNGSDYPR